MELSLSTVLGSQELKQRATIRSVLERMTPQGRQLGWGAGMKGEGGKALRPQRLATGILWVRAHGLHQNGGSGNGEKGMKMNKRAQEGAAGPDS